MKLAYIHNVSPKSKSANLMQVISMCNAFSELDVKVHLILAKSNIPIEKLKKHLIKNNNLSDKVKVHYLYPKTNFKKLNKWLNYFSIKKVILSINPDFCFVRNPLFLRKCLQLKIKTFIEVHNNRLHHGNKLLNFLLCNSIIYNQNNVFLVKIIAISQNLKNFWLKRGIKRNNIIALHDGFDLNRFRKIIDINIARNKLKLPNHSTIVTYTGNLKKNRGTDKIIFLAEKFPELLFLVVGGNASQIKKHKKLANKLNTNNIIFKGYVNTKDIPLYLFASDILLAIWSKNVPTINYCSPLKIFEYMAAEKIIIAEGFKTIKEVLNHKVTALLSDPDDFESLCKNIEFAKNNMNSLKIISEKSRNLALKEFSWKKRAKHIITEI